MAPRGGGAEGRPERADLYSMQRWCPLAGRRKYSAICASFELRPSCCWSLWVIPPAVWHAERARPVLGHARPRHGGTPVAVLVLSGWCRCAAGGVDL